MHDQQELSYLKTSESLFKPAPIGMLMTKLLHRDKFTQDDLPGSIDFSEWHPFFDQIFRVGYESGKENSWILEYDGSNYQLKHDNIGTERQVRFLVNRKDTFPLKIFAHNHPFRLPFESYRNRDSERDPQISDLFSPYDLMKFINGFKGDPPEAQFIISGGHIMLGFRTDISPVYKELDKGLTLRLLSKIIGFQAKFEGANLVEILGDALYDHNCTNTRWFESLKDKTARKLICDLAREWGIALYEINNFRMHYGGKDIGKRII